MGRIRLVGLDLDGTLLDSNKGITAPTLTALEAAAARGVALVPVTGRPLDGIPALVRQLPFVRYLISCNGASIHDARTGSSLRERCIPVESALRLATLLSDLHLPYEVLCEGVGYSEAWVYERLIAHSPQSAFLRRYVKETRRIIPDLPAFIAAGKGVEELFVMAGRPDAVADCVKRLGAIDGLHVVHPAPTALEITAEGVDKGEALLHLAAHLGIDQAETMAIGDSGNDVAMLRAAGISVAMGNAEEAIKSLSGYVTASNDEHGVALALERFVLL